MVNLKDIYYVRDVIDLSGGLMNDFINIVKSYLE